jgi:hypothetical protein
MDVNPVELLPLARLRHNPDNPKRPMGARYQRGLRASLGRFGFAGLFVVAGPDPDGTYEVLDGNTRLDELDGAGVQEAPCVVLDLDADGRKEFVLSHDRNRKVYDEDAVVSQLKALAQRGKDLKALADLTSTENLKQLVDASQKAGSSLAKASAGKMAPQSSLTLYGPTEDVDAVRQIIKRLKGRMPPLVKLRQTMEQADQFLDVTDEQFLLAFGSALRRIAEVAP